MRVVLLLLLAGCPSAPEPEPRELSGDPLSDEAYRFCHVPGADATEARKWCDLLADLPEERCPGLRKTCEGAAEEAVLEPGGCAGLPSGSPTSAPATPPEPPSEPWSLDWEPPGCDVPVDTVGWVTAVMKWVGAIGVALLLLGLLRVIGRVLGRGAPRPEAPVAPAAAEVAIPEADEIPEAPSADLLAAARGALGDGRFGDAVLLARGAALRVLGDAGRIRLHRSRTDREYVRSVRREPELGEPLGDVVRAVEQHRWGGSPVDRDLAARVVGAAERILRAIGAVLLLALLVGAGDAWRYGPSGDAALFEVFARRGYQVSWRLRGLSSLGGDTDVLVLDLTGVDPGEAEWEAIRAWVEGGGILLLGGSPPDALPELGRTVVLAPGAVPHRVPWLEGAIPPPRWPDGPGEGRIADAVWPWVVVDAGDESPIVVGVLPLGSGAVLAISDARLLYNGALIAPQNERFLGEALRVGEENGFWVLPSPTRIQLATVSAAGSDSPLGTLADARLLPLVLQLMALVALAALWKGWPFGPLRDPAGEGRLRFSDHLRALGARYARLGASRHALASYASLQLGRLGPHGLEDAARQAGYPRERATELVRRLQEVVAAPDGPDRRGDLALMEELWSITKHR